MSETPTVECDCPPGEECDPTCEVCKELDEAPNQEWGFGGAPKPPGGFTNEGPASGRSGYSS